MGRDSIRNMSGIALLRVRKVLSRVLVLAVFVSSPKTMVCHDYIQRPDYRQRLRARTGIHAGRVLRILEQLINLLWVFCNTPPTSTTSLVFLVYWIHDFALLGTPSTHLRSMCTTLEPRIPHISTSQLVGISSREGGCLGFLHFSLDT
jgi:hypothetical protein